MKRSGLSVMIASILFAGCAGTDCRAPVGDPRLTPMAASADGEHVGELVQWGGALVETRHREARTELEVVSYALDNCGRPHTGSAPTGRFIIDRPGFMETTDYETGRLVSATGRITGVREGKVGDVSYKFPLLESYKVKFLPRRRLRESYSRPWVTIGIGGGSGGVGGGVGVVF